MGRFPLSRGSSQPNPGVAPGECRISFIAGGFFWTTREALWDLDWCLTKYWVPWSSQANKSPQWSLDRNVEKCQGSDWWLSALGPFWGSTILFFYPWGGITPQVVGMVISKPSDMSSRSSPSNQRLILKILLKKRLMKKRERKKQKSSWSGFLILINRWWTPAKVFWVWPLSWAAG